MTQTSRLSRLLAAQRAGEALQSSASAPSADPSAAAPEGSSDAPAALAVVPDPGPPAWLPPEPEERRVLGYIVSRKMAVNIRGTSVYLEAGRMITEPMLVQAMIDNRADMTAVREGDDVVSCPHCQRSFLASLGRMVAHHLGLRSAA